MTLGLMGVLGLVVGGWLYYPMFAAPFIEQAFLLMMDAGARSDISELVLEIENMPSRRSKYKASTLARGRLTPCGGCLVGKPAFPFQFGGPTAS